MYIIRDHEINSKKVLGTYRLGYELGLKTPEIEKLFETLQFNEADTEIREIVEKMKIRSKQGEFTNDILPTFSYESLILAYPFAQDLSAAPLQYEIREKALNVLDAALELLEPFPYAPCRGEEIFLYRLGIVLKYDIPFRYFVESYRKTETRFKSVKFLHEIDETKSVHEALEVIYPEHIVTLLKNVATPDMHKVIARIFELGIEIRKDEALL